MIDHSVQVDVFGNAGALDQNVTIEFERFLTAARQVLLETATGEQPPDSSDLAALPFFAALVVCAGLIGAVRRH